MNIRRSLLDIWKIFIHILQTKYIVNIVFTNETTKYDW